MTIDGATWECEKEHRNFITGNVRVEEIWLKGKESVAVLDMWFEPETYLDTRAARNWVDKTFSAGWGVSYALMGGFPT